MVTIAAVEWALCNCVGLLEGIGWVTADGTAVGWWPVGLGSASESVRVASMKLSTFSPN